MLLAGHFHRPRLRQAGCDMHADMDFCRQDATMCEGEQSSTGYIMLQYVYVCYISYACWHAPPQSRTAARNRFVERLVV